MADDVAVGEVRHDEVIAFIHGALHLLRHGGQAQHRLLIEGDALGGRDAQVRLPRERLVIAAVEEEGHMGKLLRFGAVELAKSRLAEHLGQGLLHPLGSKGDGQVLEFLVIHGHDGEVQVRHVLPLKMGKVLVGEGLGQLDLPLAPAAAEHHMVAVFDFANGLALLVHQDHGFQGVIGLALDIGILYGLGQGLAAVKALVKHSSCPPSAQRRENVQQL